LVVGGSLAAVLGQTDIPMSHADAADRLISHFQTHAQRGDRDISGEIIV